MPELGVPADTQFGIHRALFPPFEQASDYLKELKRMQLTGNGQDDDERRITLLMVAGGHFAGMVVGLRPRGKNEKQEVKAAGEVRVIKHKTFHRYTSECGVPAERNAGCDWPGADGQHERSKEVLKRSTIMPNPKPSRQVRCSVGMESRHYRKRLGH